MFRKIISCDNYEAIGNFGESLSKGPITVMLSGDEKAIKIAFGMSNFYRILSRSLFSESFYPKALIDGICHSEHSEGVYIVNDNFLIDFVKYRACGFADWFDLQHYLIVSSNIVIDILVEDYSKPVFTELSIESSGGTNGKVD